MDSDSTKTSIMKNKNMKIKIMFVNPIKTIFILYILVNIQIKLIKIISGNVVFLGLLNSTIKNLL